MSILKRWCSDCCGLREKVSLNQNKYSEQKKYICGTCNGFGWIPFEPIWEGNIEDVGLDKQFPLLGEVPISWKGVAIYLEESDLEENK